MRYAVRWELRARLEVIVADREAKAVIELLVGLLDDDPKRDEALLITRSTTRFGSARRGGERSRSEPGLS